MASDGGRSLSAGISIPQWMKGRIGESRFDTDDILSPPDNEDSFLYIYPKKVREIREIAEENTKSLVESQKENAPLVDAKDNTCTVSKSGQKIDFNNYTAPCKPFLINSDNHLRPTAVKLSPDQKIKSNGTDDGFKGEAAKCGSSVIKMAQQIVSGKLSRNASENSLDEEVATLPPNFDPQKRRNSKSLPASPLTTPNTSPKSKRKMNKYFSGSFVANENYQGSWILSNLMKRRDMSKSVDQIVEVDEIDTRTPSVVEIAHEHDNGPKLEKKIKNIYVPRPEEIREMNFWSPTTM